MEAGEESGPDCQHLGIELGGSGHGRGPGQQDHPPGRLERGGWDVGVSVIRVRWSRAGS